MSTHVIQVNGTTDMHSVYTGEEAEISVDTTKDTVVVHDGVTQGGHPLAKEDALAATTDRVAILEGDIDYGTLT